MKASVKSPESLAIDLIHIHDLREDKVEYAKRQPDRALSIPLGENFGVLKFLGLDQKRPVFFKEDLVNNVKLMQTFLRKRGAEPEAFDTKREAKKPYWWEDKKQNAERLKKFSWDADKGDKSMTQGTSFDGDGVEGVLGLLALFEFAIEACDPHKNVIVRFTAIASHVSWQWSEDTGSCHIHGTMEFTSKQRVSKQFKIFHRSQIGFRTEKPDAYLGYIGEPHGRWHLEPPYEKGPLCHCFPGIKCHLQTEHLGNFGGITCKCQQHRNICTRRILRENKVHVESGRVGRIPGAFANAPVPSKKEISRHVQAKRKLQ